MITDSFDVKTEAIITPEDYYGPQKHICDICIITFSRVIFQEVMERYECRKEGEIGSCAGNIPIYSFEINRGKLSESKASDVKTATGKKSEGRNIEAQTLDEDTEPLRIGILLCSIGSVAAGTNITESNWLIGATKFILFGSAGSLDNDKTKGKYTVPDKAYRDEGMSYHYVPPADYIDVPGCQKVSEIFDEVGIPYVKGGCWTTDSFYRETRGLMEKRKSEGCLAVDMEVSGAQAVCDFYGFSLYCFLETGDVLDEHVYDAAGLFDANHDLNKFFVALEIAKRI